MTRTGQCFCGSVQYRINGPVFDARSCHCSRCRKAFSAQASSYALIKEGTLEWISGENLLTFYPPEGNFGKAFCSKCGSTLCGIVEGKVHGITLGCLDDDQDIAIEKHIFVGSKASWEQIPDNVVTHDSFPPEWLHEEEK